MKFTTAATLVVALQAMAIVATPVPANLLASLDSAVSETLSTAAGLCAAIGNLGPLSLFDLLGTTAKRDLSKVEERATTTLAPVGGGRTYDVVTGSEGHITTSDTYYSISGTAGACLIFNYGASYFNGIFVTGNPERFLFPYSAIGNDFDTGVEICQAACDNIPNLAAAANGGSATCEAIAPWVSVPYSTDPFRVFGDFFVCDMYPRKLTTSDVLKTAPVYVSDGVIANAE